MPKFPTKNSFISKVYKVNKRNKYRIDIHQLELVIIYIVKNKVN